MNRKSYLKGLGVGIIVTCLILIISGKFNNKMSDEDVIKRAKELGYVQSSTLVSIGKDDVGEDLTVKEDIVKDENDLGEGEDIEEKQKDEEDEVQLNEQIKETKENEIQKEDEKVDEEDSSIETHEKDVKEDKIEGQRSDEEILEFVVVSINSGESSETVCGKVQSAGLVEDAGAFNKFLCANGYDKILRVGNHEIPAGSDEDEIAKILCGK